MATPQSLVSIPPDQNWHFGGQLSCKEFVYPKESLDNSAVDPSAAIEATKLIHRHVARYYQAAGADVAAVVVPVHLFRGDATIVAVEAIPLTAPAGGDKAFAVDVKKGNQSTPPVTILSAPLAVSVAAGVSDREEVDGILAVTTAADGDFLEVVITVSGTTGTQGQGVLVTVWFDEKP